MQRQDIMGEDDSSGVSHFINSSPLGVGPGERTAPALMSLNTRLLSGSLVYPSSPSSSGYHIAADRTNPSWGGGQFIHSTGISNYPTSSTSSSTTTIATGLRPRSAADSGLDHHFSYFDSYHDRPSTFHTAGSSPSSGAYTYGVAPDSLLLRSDTSSYIPTSQLGSYLQDYPSSSLPNAPGVSDTGHIGMVPSQQCASGDAFYSSDGLYSLGDSASQQGHESAAQDVNTLQPSLSFTLPGIPSAEEAFLTHIHQSTNSMNDVIGEPLPGDPRRDLLMLPSGYQQPLDFGNENHQDIERNLYHTHIGTRSPSSSDSSRSSQKRAREELDALPSTGAESSWGVASPAIKRQRLDEIADGFSSSINSRGRTAHASGFPNRGPSFGSDEDADEDDFFDSGNDDSDAYIPSRSPSPALPTVLLTSPSPPTEEGKGGRRGRAKGKAKGSAARALAMITKVREQQDLQEMTEFGYTEWSGGDGEGTSYYPLGGGASEGEGSNNDNRSTPAQAPVPVPNLMKKSRGRKVPYVAALRGGEGIGEGFPVSGIVAMSPSGRRGRRRAAAGGSAGATSDGFQAQVPTGEDRSFVCVVPGCGKCFVRAEHLKRHVRSIHTDDKPFLCPHKGCGKSFSRRDNLGQHVRIHLND